MSEYLQQTSFCVTAWTERQVLSLGIYSVKEHEQLGDAPGFTCRQEIHGTSIQLRRVLQVISLTTHALKLILIYKIGDVDTIKNWSWNPRAKTSKTCAYQCSVPDSLYKSHHHFLGESTLFWVECPTKDTRSVRILPPPFAFYSENRQPLPLKIPPQRIDTPHVTLENFHFLILSLTSRTSHKRVFWIQSETNERINNNNVKPHSQNILGLPKKLMLFAFCSPPSVWWGWCTSVTTLLFLIFVCRIVYTDTDYYFLMASQQKLCSSAPVSSHSGVTLLLYSHF